MPRQSQIDADSVLDAAMALFWAQGYRATSMDDLVRATGANRYGLYDLFDDKRGLFLAALERYQQVIVNRLFAGVEAPDAGIEQVRGYFQGLLALAASPQGRWGCLMVNTAVENDDARIDAAVSAYRTRLRQGFGDILGEAKADFMVALAFGVLAQARAGAEPKALRAAVDHGLRSLSTSG